MRLSRPFPTVLAAVMILGASQLRAETRRTVRWTVAPDVRLEGVLRLENAAGTSDAIDVPFAGSVAEAGLPEGSRWYATLIAPGWWSARERVAVDADKTVTLQVFPTGRVSGQLILENPQDRLPKSFTMQIEDPPALPQRLGLPKGASAECVVSDRGRWTCEVPAGTVDLVVRPKGFVPHYRWGQRIVRGSGRDLGSMTLRAGASVAGRVQVEGRRAKAAGARARLLRIVPLGATGRAGERLRRPIAEGIADEAGFFQLTGLSAGSYALIVEQAGFAPAEIYPIEVYEGSETAVRAPLILRPPIDLRLAVSPARDWTGKPWQVVITPIAAYTGMQAEAPIFSGPVNEAGELTVPNQAPGDFNVVVTDALHDPFSYSTMRATSDIDPRYEVRIAMVHVSGSLKRGDTALPGSTLWFGGRHGALHSSTKADGDGLFEVYLPNGGDWSVEVEAERPSVKTRLHVPVSADEHGEAEVAIELPDNWIEGFVVDAEEKPVAGALVSLSAEQPMASTSISTDREGRFVFRSVAEGRVRLTGRVRRDDRERPTEDAYLTVHEGPGGYGPFTLRVQTMKQLAGKVVSPRGGVAGALVRFLASPGQPPDEAHVVTDADGTFAVDVPEAWTSAVAAMSPPGHAFRALRVPVDGRKLLLHVESVGGELIVRLPAETDLEAARRTIPVLMQDGLVLPQSDLIRWAIGHGRDLQALGYYAFPNMSAGSYRVCIGPRALLAPGEEQRWYAQARCKEATLAPGATLQLDLRGE